MAHGGDAGRGDAGGGDAGGGDGGGRNAPPPLPPTTWLAPAWRAELAPFPGRGLATARMVLACLSVVAISMTLQIPEAALSAYMVFFVSRADLANTVKTAIGLVLALTVGCGLTLLAYQATLDNPALRLALMSLLFCAGMYLSRVFVAGALGFGIGFILLVTQVAAELFPSAEALVRGVLWIWMAIVFPIVILVVANLLMPPAGAAPGATAPPRPRQLFVADALSNPVYLQFGLKSTLAAMLCYIAYTALDWPGIHTSVITCAVIALGSADATLHKAAQRVAGALAGGALACLATVFIVPQLESLGGLLLLIAPVAALSAWIANGSQRHAYFGWQIAFAFFLCVLHGDGPSADVTIIRDRLVGVLLGIAVMAVVFTSLWPEREAAQTPPSPAN